MILDNISRSTANELARDVRNLKYEIAESGVLFPRSRLFIGGAFRVTGGDGESTIDANTFTNEGLNYVLNAAFGGGAPITQFFLAPFSSNVTPNAGWTAATFPGAATEFTAYTNPTRPQWVEANSDGQVIGNTASQAVFTFNAGGPYNLYGMALLSSSAKGAATGVLAAAMRFAAPRLNQLAGDRLAVEYTLSAMDDGL